MKLQLMRSLHACENSCTRFRVEIPSNIRNRKYDSYSSLSSGDDESASTPRSATTQAKKK